MFTTYYKTVIRPFYKIGKDRLINIIQSNIVNGIVKGQYLKNNNNLFEFHNDHSNILRLN